MCKRNGTQYVFPDVHATKLEFSSFNSMVNAPFVIYADLETMITHEVRVNKGKTVSRQKHVPVSIGTLTMCRDRPDFGSELYIYTGLDCIEMLMVFLNGEVMRLRDKYDRMYVPYKMTPEDWKFFSRAKSCEMCHRHFSDFPQLVKVRDHCHISGHFRFVLCSQCNLTRAKRPFQVYVFFHGLSNYDSDFLIQKLGMYRQQNISVIPQNSEKYLSFSLGCLKFKDSYQFL